MNSQSSQRAAAPAGCFILLIVAYLVIGLVVYAAAYGEPSGFSLTLFLVVALWPVALFWWSLIWIFCGVVIVLVCLGLKHIWDGL